MQVANYVDINFNPIIDAIVATSNDEEQLLVLFEDLTDSDKGRVLEYIESLLRGYRASPHRSDV